MSDTPATPPADWLTVRELGDRWKLATSTVYKLIKDGELLARQFGSAWRVHRTAVEEYEKPGIVAKRAGSERFRNRPDVLGLKGGKRE